MRWSGKDLKYKKYSIVKDKRRCMKGLKKMLGLFYDKE